MAKKYNLRLIKERESYSFRDVSKLLNIHIRTVQVWKSEGLQTLNDLRPFLVMGYELKEFLSKRISSHRHKLKENEFYCTKCRKAVTSLENKVQLKLSNKTIGVNAYREILICGNCGFCNTRINRFSHEGKFQEIKNNFQIVDYGGIQK